MNIRTKKIAGNFAQYIVFRTSLLICLLNLVFGFIYSCTRQEDNPEKIIGVKIYEYNRDFNDLFSEWNTLGINTVFVSPALDSVSAFRTEAVKHQIRRFLILPTFFNPEILKTNPGLYAITDKGVPAREEWVEFVCPNNAGYRQNKMAYIRNLIEQLQPDGISIDFIRYFAFWEKIYPERSLASLTNSCFDKTCLDKFCNDTGIKIPENLQGTEPIAAWIIENYTDEWTRWKCHTITSMVQEISAMARAAKPSIIINLHAVPWRSDDYDGAIKKIIGQDFADLAKYVDYISPMCYHHMVKREPEWIHDVTQDIYKQTKSRILPSIQVGKAYLANGLSPEDFRTALQNSLKSPSAGVVFWNWNAIDESPAKKKIIQQLLIEKREL